MKRITSIIIVLLTWISSAQAQPKATFDKEAHAFGTILWKNPATAVFTITNTGDKPLVISNVTTSCGCTDAEWTKSPIAPGESGSITSTFDAKALGRFRKSIGVYCNAAVRPIYLSLSGEVTADPKKTITLPYQIGYIKLDKDVIEFDDANKGEKPFVELMVANTSSKPYQPVLMHLPPYLSAESVPEVLPKDGYGKIKITLDTDKLPKFGLTKATVYLSRFMGDKVSDENAIPVSAVLLPDFSGLTAQELQHPPVVEVSTTEVDMGVLNGKMKKSQQIVIRNVGERDLEISDLQVLDSAVGVHLKKHVLKPGASTKLKVTAYGQYVEGLKRMPRVIMITNDPNRPKIIIHVKVSSK